MKGLYMLYGIGIVAALSVACSDSLEDMEGCDIALNAVVSDIQSSSRASVATPFKGVAPTESSILSADVWFSTTSGEYGNNGTAPTYLPCRTTVDYKGVLVKPTNGAYNLKYPIGTDADKPVYLVGFSPSGWTTTNGTSASHAIDGSQDLMYAPEVYGTWTNPIEEQEYRHLLTWLKVCICATDPEAITAWGKVTKISVESNGQVDITALGSNGGTIAYSGATPIVALDTPKNLQTTMQEVGSVFCSPEIEYTVTVETSLGGTKCIEIPLNILNPDDSLTAITDEGQAVGRLFILTLYFNRFDLVEGVCTLNSWNNQDEDLYLQ